MSKIWGNFLENEIWKPPWTSSYSIGTTKQRNRKIANIFNENQTCEDIIDVELEIKEELPEILDVFSMSDQFHEK